MPQLDPEFFLSQIFWLVICFSFLLIFLWRISLPRINKALEKRQGKISSDLEKAKKYQLEAEELQKEIDKALLNANNKAEEELKNAINSYNKDMEKRIAVLDKELEGNLLNANQRIKKFEEDSLKNIKKEIKDLTAITFKKLIGSEIDNKPLHETISNISTNKYKLK